MVRRSVRRVAGRVAGEHHEAVAGAGARRGSGPVQSRLLTMLSAAITR